MIKDVRIKFSLILLFIIFFLKLTASPIFADQGSLGAYPTNYDPSNPKTKSWFIYELKPGETKEDSITVVNTKNVPVRAKVYPVDATTTADGAFALLNENQKQSDVGSWVTMSNNIVSIDANKSVDVPFTITIPKNVTVGDHPGGIIVQEVTTPSTVTPKEGLGLTIVSRVGTRIYETVPGAKVVNLDLSDFTYKISDGHLVFSFTLLNKGNIILTPTGKVEVKDYSGKVVDTITLGNLGSAFPGKPVAATAKSEKSAPWFGQYNAIATIDYSPLKSVAKSISFFIYIRDWKEVIPIPAIILLIAIFFIVRRLLTHAHHIKRIVDEQRELRKQDIEDIKEKVKTHATKIKSHVDKAKREMEKMATTILPQPAFVPAYEPNIDQMFVARHIKLLAVLVSISIIVLSSLFAFILQFLVFSKVMASQKTNPPPVVSEAPIPTDVPTPTDIPVKKEDMKVTVLNGTDTVGLAKTVSEKLTAEGFTVTNIDNAENRTGTLIQYPTGQKNGANLLEEVLKPDYATIETEATDSSEFTVTLGK